MAKKSTTGSVIQSLDRGLVILQDVAASKNPTNLADLAELLNIDRSSAFRLAQTLRRRGFLSNPPGRKDYILGSAIWTLSRQYDWSNMLVYIAHTELKDLAHSLKETSHLAVRQGTNALFIDSIHARRTIAVSGQMGELVPLYATAHGKALLADSDESDLKGIFGNTLQKHTETTIQTFPALAMECRSVRERGYATDEAEYVEGTRCVAAPIRGDYDVIVGSIGISAPNNRLLKEQYSAYAKQVMQCANRIAKVLSSAK